MRTALLLLTLLALAAIPGTVLPQRGLNPVKVDQFISNHPHLGSFFDRLSLYFCGFPRPASDDVTVLGPVPTGYAGSETELRLQALSPFEPTGTTGVIGEQRAHFAGVGEVALPRYDRGALAPSDAVAGPALIEDEWSTTLVYPGQRCVADRLGNLIIETAERSSLR